MYGKPRNTIIYIDPKRQIWRALLKIKDLRAFYINQLGIRQVKTDT